MEKGDPQGPPFFVAEQLHHRQLYWLTGEFQVTVGPEESGIGGQW
jgi:hypothetical protein